MSTSVFTCAIHAEGHVWLKQWMSGCPSVTSIGAKLVIFVCIFVCPFLDKRWVFILSSGSGQCGTNKNFKKLALTGRCRSDNVLKYKSYPCGRLLHCWICIGPPTIEICSLFHTWSPENQIRSFSAYVCSNVQKENLHLTF